MRHPTADPDPPDERRRRFHRMYLDNHDPILGYVLRRTDDSHDAADVIAETFLVAWRRFDEIPLGDQARPWLYGVARRVLANQRRGRRRRFALTEELGARLRTDLAGAWSPHQSRIDSSAVGRAFRALPERDRELLALVGWEGLDHGQIATALGCSRNAVRIRLHRARKRLARELRRGDATEASETTLITKGEPA